MTPGDAGKLRFNALPVVRTARGLAFVNTPYALEVLRATVKSITKVVEDVKDRETVRQLFERCPILCQVVIGRGPGTLSSVRPLPEGEFTPFQLLLTVRALDECDHQVRSAAVGLGVITRTPGECTETTGCRRCWPALYDSA